MDDILVYPAGDTPALRFACKALFDRGLHIADSPSDSVTHLLLPVPSFEANGCIKGGDSLDSVLSRLPQSVAILGGNLGDAVPEDRTGIDLLQDPLYLAENAAITAECAIRIAANHLPVIFCGCPVLIIGWGRIGKCLADKLKAMGANVTVAARKETDRAALQSLGYRAKHPSRLLQVLGNYRIIFNTAPAPVITEEQANCLRSDSIKIDLASQQGIFCQDVILARGLPNQDAPESSGHLIAKTVLRLISEKEVSL